MKRNTILIVIILLLIILIGGLAYIFFMTDILKSDKELFYKYLLQADLKSFFEIEDFDKYQEKLENNKYQTDSKINIKIPQMDNWNEEINISSKNDLKNQLSSATINLKNNEEDILNAEYLRNEDLHGIIIENVILKYLVIENNNLKDLAQKLGETNVTSIPDKIEFSREKLISNKEINEIYNRYLPVIINNIPKECYSKTNKEQINVEDELITADGYKLTLKVNNVKKILNEILITLQSDEQIFNIIAKNNEEVDFETYKQTIQDKINELNEMEDTNENIEFANVIVYKKGKQIEKLCINIKEENEEILNIEKTANKIIITEPETSYSTAFSKNDISKQETKIIISKTTNTQNEKKWNIKIDITIDEEVQTFNIDIVIKGLEKLQEINNEINLEYYDNSESNEKININLINKTQFNETIEIPRFEENNYAIINNATSEEIENFFIDIQEKLKQEIDFEKTLIGKIIGMRTYILMQKVQETSKQVQEQAQKILEQQQEMMEDQERYINGL